MFRKKLGLYFDFEEFMNNIYDQIDFDIEGSNGIKFQELYSDSPTIYFPKIIDYTRNIFIAEYVEKIDFESLSEYQKNLSVLNLCGFMFDSILTTNFVHGDMHCKNWSIIKNNDENLNLKYKVVIFDYGICFNSESVKFNQKLFDNLEHAKVYEVVQLMKHSRGLINIDNYIDNDEEIEIDESLNKKLNEIDKSLRIPNSYGVYLLVTKILEEEDVIICKFLMNIFIILFMIDNLLIKHNIHREINYGNQLFNHLRDVKLEIKTFCEVKKTYPRLVNYLKKELLNLDFNKNKINEDELNINLFNSVESSKLIFKPIDIDN